MTQHTQGNWTFRARDLGGKLGNSYAVDLPNGATTFSSSNDDNAEANMRLVSAAPQLLEACHLLIRAYALGEENDAHVEWNDVDRAHDAAQAALALVQP